MITGQCYNDNDHHDCDDYDDSNEELDDCDGDMISEIGPQVVFIFNFDFDFVLDF